MPPVVINLPGYLAPGLNGKAGLIRAHWATRRREAEVVTKLLRAAWDGTVLPGPVEVDYTRFYSRLPMDWDNAGASFKLIGDALVELGVIPDDGPEVIRAFRPHQIKVPKKDGEGTRLLIRRSEK